MARFANLLSHYTGSEEYRAWAEKAMTFLSASRVVVNGAVPEMGVFG